MTSSRPGSATPCGLIAAVLAIALGGPALATNGDDFDDDLTDPARWGADVASGAGTLGETGGRLEFAVAAPTADDHVARPWIAEDAPVDANWEVRIDLANTSLPLEADEVSSFGINVVSGLDGEDDFFAEMYVSRLTGGDARRGFFAEMRADGVALPFADSGGIDGREGAVRIAFDAGTQVLSAYYDADPSDGHTWTPFASFGTAGAGGSDGNADFGLGSGDHFRIEVFGYAASLVVASGQMSGDDFVTEGLVPRAAGLTLAITDDDHAWAGDPLIPYRVTVANPGAFEDDLVLHETVPAATTFSAADSTPGWVCTPGPEEGSACSFALGDLATGESREVVFAARVTEGTRLEFDVFNEAEVNPRRSETTGSGSCPAGFPAFCCFSELLEAFFGFSATAPVRPAAEPPLELALQYRVRDRLLRATPGGRRLTDLYYDHSPALVTAAMEHPSLVPLARDALLAWQPHLQALLDGTGETTPVEATAVERFTAFLDALAPLASPPLRAAMMKERALMEVEGWPGRSAAEVLDLAVERVSCEEAATFASVECRLDQLALLTERLVPAGKIATRLLKSARRTTRFVDAAASAVAQEKPRRLRAALRKLSKTLAGIERRLGSRAAVKVTPPEVAAMLAAEASGLRADVGALGDP